MRYQGLISEWNDERGFGFVTPRDGGERAFVHISEFPCGSRRPADGEAISYALRTDERGRLQAASVRYLVGRGPATGPAHKRTTHATAACVVAVAFLAALVAAAALGVVPRALPALYVVASVAAYVAYSRDKRAAQQGGWRIKESTLLLLGLCGGWPGALMAQHRLRHKTRKATFQVAYWTTVVANCGGLVWVVML